MIQWALFLWLLDGLLWPRLCSAGDRRVVVLPGAVPRAGRGSEHALRPVGPRPALAHRPPARRALRATRHLRRDTADPAPMASTCGGSVGVLLVFTAAYWLPSGRCSTRRTERAGHSHPRALQALWHPGCGRWRDARCPHRFGLRTHQPQQRPGKTTTFSILCGFALAMQASVSVLGVEARGGCTCSRVAWPRSPQGRALCLPTTKWAPCCSFYARLLGDGARAALEADARSALAQVGLSET